jgi:hypothetical protein
MSEGGTNFDAPDRGSAIHLATWTTVATAFLIVALRLWLKIRRKPLEKMLLDAPSYLLITALVRKTQP